MFRITTIIVLLLSCSYFNAAQQTKSTNEAPTMFDVNNAKFCEKPSRCLPYAQCHSDNTYNTQGIGTIILKFTNEASNEINVGDAVYTLTANNTITTRNGVERTVCKYYERCCGEASIPQPVVQPKPKVIVTDCGYSNPNGIGFEISNPGKSQFGEYPWMVAVILKNPVANTPALVGGGSLIHPNVVLTAPHILGDRASSEFIVRAGEWDTQSESETIRHQDRNVKTIIIHEDFHNTAASNDYALIVLDEQFILDEHIRPICLPTENLYFDDMQCFSAGWGKIDFLHREHRLSILKKIELPVIPFETCQEQLRKTQLGDIFELHDSFICAGGVGGNDTCSGDGGSPLMCPVYNQPNRYHQAGIVAWGLGCGLDGIPGVYANVALARRWIDSKMKALGYDDSSYSTS